MISEKYWKNQKKSSDLLSNKPSNKTHIFYIFRLRSFAHEVKTIAVDYGKIGPTLSFFLKLSAQISETNDRPNQGLLLKMDRKALAQTFFREQISQNYNKAICSYAQQWVTWEFSSQHLYFWSKDKSSNFTSVIEAKWLEVGPVREVLGQFFKLFCLKKYAKTLLKLF